MALEQDTGQDSTSAPLRGGLPAPDTTSPEVSTAYPPDQPSAAPSIVAALAGGQTMAGGTYGTVPEPDDTQNLATQFGVPTLTSQQYQGLLEADRENERARIGAEGGMLRRMERLDAINANRMEASLAAQQAEGRHLQPWNAQAEMAARKHDLWEQFGSPGFLIAMMASAFTAMPMVSALNGGAAAMNAINQGDLDAYDKAFEAWKTNTDLVLKRMDMQQRTFQDLNALRTSDLNAWKEKMQTALAMYDDQRKLNMLNYGLDEEVIKAQEAEAQLQTQLASAKKAIEENNIRNMLVYGNPSFPFDASGKLKPGAKIDAGKMAQIVQDAEMAMTPGAKSAEQLAIQTLISTPGFRDQDPAVQRQQINEVVSGVAGARYGAKGPLANTEVRRQWDAWDAANPQQPDESDADYETRKSNEHGRIYREFLENQALSKLSTQEREMRQEMDKSDAAHPDDTPEQRSDRHREIYTKWVDAKAHPKIAEQYAKQLSNPQWLASPEGQAWIAQQPPEAQADYAKFIKNFGKGRIKNPADAGWTPEAITAAAETFNETGILPRYLGARTDGPLIMGAVQARANDLLKEKYPDKTEVERIQARTKQWQIYHTQQVAINRFVGGGKQSDTLRSLNVVVQHLQTLAELEDALGNNDKPKFRQVSQWWAMQFGQEAPTDFETAAMIVGNEVVKAIQGGNMGTGEERTEVEKTFSRIKSPDQLYGAIAVAQRLLVGQIRGMKHAFLSSTGLGEADFDRILLPETRAYFGEAELKAMSPMSDEPPSEKVRRQLQPGKAPVIELDPIK